jgi:ABC-type multidrug transport system fused ATPase/permease subunit
MKGSRTPSDPGLLGLCHWALGYAWRRGLALMAVTLTLLLKIGLDLLKPWPMVFLVDYVLQGKTTPLALRVADALPGSPTPGALIFWSVAATVVLFVLGWTASLANAYANISLGQRMVYDLASDLFARLQSSPCVSTPANLLGDICAASPPTAPASRSSSRTRLFPWSPRPSCSSPCSVCCGASTPR